MPATITITDTHTVTSTAGQQWVSVSMVPVPGLHPTSVTVTLGAAALSTTQFQLKQEGGVNNNVTIGTNSLSTGASSKTQALSNVVGADATGLHYLIISGSHSPSGYIVNSTIATTFSDATATFCPYGTRPTSTAPAVAFVTDAAIAAACTLIGAPWLAVLFAPLIGYAIDTGALCGTGPPAMPAIGNDDLLGDIGSKMAALQSTLWYSLCECVPGNPLPAPYVPPTLSPPTGWPTSTGYSCDPADLCATLTLILKRLDQLSTTTAGISQVTTLLQRYGLPFATVTGPLHPGLSGAGSFAVSRLVGIRVDITSALPGRQLEGTPAYIWDLGWMSIGTAQGMLVEKRITRDPEVWQPDRMQEATTVGYFLKAGVTATITELRPEPA